MTTETSGRPVDHQRLLATTLAILTGDTEETLALDDLTPVCKMEVMLRLTELVRGHMRWLICEDGEAMGMMHGRAALGIGDYSLVAAMGPKRATPRLTWYAGNSGIFEAMVYGTGDNQTLMCEVHRLTRERATWRFAEDPALATRMLRESYSHIIRAMRSALGTHRHNSGKIREQMSEVERIMRALGMGVPSASSAD